MAIYAFESVVRNGEVVVPENVVLPESGKVYIILPDEDDGETSSTPSAEFEISEREK